jgi:hypothetical protein
MIMGKMGLYAITGRAGPKSDVPSERIANGIVPRNWTFLRRFMSVAPAPATEAFRWARLILKCSLASTELVVMSGETAHARDSHEHARIGIPVRTLARRLGRSSRHSKPR